jgi:PPK2 family polyphosphate:nucleotide phosphotransferase
MAEAPSRNRIAELIEPLRVKPGSRISLARDFNPAYTTPGIDKHHADDILDESITLLREYQARLTAEGTRALLVVLQALDAAGKDGTIKHVMTGVNPQGVEVHAFKVPSAEDLAHDYLWRYSKKLPERGRIGIFNRSHYEEVLVVRVHPENLIREHLPPSTEDEDVWERRFREINNWERYLVDNGTHIVKLFLDVSKEEQRERFLARIQTPDKNWKFSAHDVQERRHWDDYQRAYEAVLSNTSTRWAPWYVIPADHKWFAHLAAGAAILHALMEMDPQYPTVSAEERAELEQEGKLLQSESPH